MKKRPKITLIVLFICFTCSTTQAQNMVQQQLTLSVERTKDNETKELFFKPNKKLKLQTKSGEMLVSSDYSFLNNAIALKGEKITVIERNQRHQKFKKTTVSDTILIADIDWIKGRVFEDGGRKALGGLVLLTGTAALFIPVASIMVGGGVAAALLALPFIPIIIKGLKMMAGTRKFKTSKGWQVYLE